MRQRILSTLVLVPIVLTALIHGTWFWAILMAFAAAMATHEYLHLVRSGGWRPTALISYAMVLALTVAAVKPRFDHEDRAILALGVVAAFLAQIRRQGDRRSVNDWMATLAGPIYLGSLMGYIVMLRDQPGGLAWTTLLFGLVWANDSAAYLVGRSLGQRPFFPSISPKKTLEGALGGTAATVLLGASAPFLARLIVPAIARLTIPIAHVIPPVNAPPLADTSPWFLAALAVAVAVAAPAGDLSQSFLKRQFGLKDAGDLIPGHGGFWDRIDSLLFAAPVVYYAVVLLEKL